MFRVPSSLNNLSNSDLIRRRRGLTTLLLLLSMLLTLVQKHYHMMGSAKHINSLITPLFNEAHVIKIYTEFSVSMINEGALVNGVFLIPSDNNPFLWFGVIFVDETRNGGSSSSSSSSHWNGGVFRFVIKFSTQDLCPTVTFLPLSPSGPLRSHPDISPESGSYKHTGGPVFKLVKALRKSFYKTYPNVDPETCKQDVEASVKCGYTDQYVKNTFRGDNNVMVLGSIGAARTCTVPNPTIGFSFF